MSGIYNILGIGAVVGLLAVEGAAFDNVFKKTPVDDIGRSIEKVVSPIVDFLPHGITSALGPSGPISTSSTIDDNALSQLKAKKYPNSLPDTVGNHVFGKDGDVAGRVYDVVVDKESGDLEEIVVGEQDAGKELELSSLPADDVAFVNPEGDVRMSIDDEELEEDAAPASEEQGELSLRTLRDANVYDHEGRLTGRVSEVTYKDNEAKRIYFDISKELVVDGVPSTFSIPYEEAVVSTDGDEANLYLTQAQTVKIADAILDR